MIADRFELMARNNPNRLALKTTKEEISYDELNKAANRVADAILQQCGEGEQPVALLLEQGAAMVVSIIGVLKAGKIYVPLDPANPRARIIDILEDSRAGLMVTNNLNVSVAEDSNGNGCPIINLDRLDDSLSTENPGLSLSPKTLASILYTSGSTGRPKGVLGNHRGVLHRVMIYTNAFHFCANDRLTLLHHCSVGAAETQLFCSLLNGAALYPFDLKTASLDALAELLIEERITIFHSGVNVYRELLHALNPEEKFPDLRLIKLGSDQITKKDVELYREHFAPGCLLVNALSMSEAGTVSWFVINKQTRINDDRVPVGYPVEEKEILLLDETGEEVGYNCVGEIAIRSRYLSPGYWRRPELTKSKFLPDPNGGDNRTFLTGDLGRMLSDGCLVHLGRKDFRVKIRGYTIEPAEIETALLELHAVKEVAVVAREAVVIAGDDALADQHESDNLESASQNLKSGKRLVAYIVPQEKTAPKINDLHNFLKEKLPDYMIPSTFVTLDAMPLTPNGKVDRKALPEPDNSRPRLDTTYVAARGELEQQLVAMWEEILNVRPVGVDDNFFDLGGYSLLGARIIGEVHRQYRLDLPLRALFESPTIAQLAAGIKHGWKKKSCPEGRDWSYLLELQAGCGRRPLFFFPGGGGSEPEFFIYAALARHLGSEYPVYGLRAQGTDGVSEPHASVEQIAAAYLEEIRAVQPEGPYYLIGECAGGVTAFEAARQLAERGEEVALLALLDVERPTVAKYRQYRAREFLCISLIKFHWEQLRRLEWSKWPAYLRGKGTGEPTSQLSVVQGAELLRARAQTVLETDHFGQAVRHVERARTKYRRVVRRYRPQTYAGLITILACEKLYQEDPTLGWSGLAQKGLRTHQVPGDHDTYLREHVHVTARHLSALIEEAQAPAAEQGARDEQLV